MNAPFIWIIFPLGIGFLLLFITNQRVLSILGGLVGLFLAATAQFIPIDTALNIASFSLKIQSSATFFGRSLLILPAEGSLLTIIYGAVALWFFGAEAANTAKRLVPIGFMITALMVASLAVEPFLYAALFIQMAILLAIPLMTNIYTAPSKGITRFLVYQTLAMPFILLAGWLLGGVESSPGDLALVTQSASILGLGFAFLLAIFPLYTWIPMLAEEVSPYILAFLLWILPTVTIIFCAGFIDRYSWIRTSPQLITALRLAGLAMLVTGGVFAAFQRNLARIMSYGAIAETGFSMLALSLDVRIGVPVLFMLIPARALGLAVWSLAVTVIKGHVQTLRFGATQGILRVLPFAGAGMIIAALSTSSFPLLAGFPGRLALWESLARNSLTAALWMGIGIAGLLTSTIRSLAVISMAEEYTSWKPRETLAQRIMLGLGVTGLFILGIFPQTIQYFLRNLPLMFEHLGH
ncbi:MAG: proton-conducting transporter membrane subunit [Bacteroidota bacterium]